MTPTNCPAKKREKQKNEAGTANQYWFFNPVILMVISASRIPCILSIPNLTLILLENPESRPSNKANPGSRETLRGGKKTKRCEKRAGAGERPAYRKSPKISPSKYKPPKSVTQKTLRQIAPPNISPMGVCTWKIALKYKVKQHKNGKFTSNYKASPIDL